MALAGGLALLAGVLAGRERSRDLTVAIVGQSNEVGAGLRPLPPLPGALQTDPIAPWGGRRSMWPRLEQLAAARGVPVWVWNSAVGATSIVHSWAGTLRVWSEGMTVVRGDYVLVGGRIFKRVGPASEPPVLASRAQPRTGRTADGIGWADMGARTATERDGQVFRPGDRLFDPNGFVHVALDGLTKRPGVKWVFISIGQGDAGDYWSVTRREYADALIAVTDAALAAGARVAIGFTSGTAKPPSERAYAERLIPGWRDALRHYARDRRVIAGANLRLALGPLPVRADPEPGLQPDRLHMNDAALDLAARAWFDALARGGVIPGRRDRPTRR